MIVSCTHCERACEVPESAKGKRAVCPSCGRVFAVIVPQAQVLEDSTLAQPQEVDSVQVASTSPAAVQGRPEEVELELAEADDQPAAAPRLTETTAKKPDSRQPEPEAVPTDRSALLRFDEKDEPKPARSATAAASTPADKGKTEDGWLVLTTKGERGPFTNRQIIDLAKQQKITPRTQLRHTRKRKLIRAGEVPGLFKTPSKASAGTAAGHMAAKAGDSASRQVIKSPAPAKPSKSKVRPPSAPVVVRQEPQLTEDLKALASAYDADVNDALNADELASVIRNADEGALSASGLAAQLAEFDEGGHLSASGLARALAGDD